MSNQHFAKFIKKCVPRRAFFDILGKSMLEFVIKE